MKRRGEYIDTGDTGQEIVNENAWNFQEFAQQERGKLLFVKLKMFKEAAATGTLDISVYAADLDHKPTGAPLQTVTKDIAELELTGDWFEVTFDNYPNMLAGNYCLVVAAQAGSGNSYWRSNPANPYPTGLQGISSNGGSSWFTNSTSDFLFEIWYDDGVHRIPVIHDFSWQPPVTAQQDSPPA